MAALQRELVDHFVFLGIDFRKRSGMSRKQLEKHILYLHGFALQDEDIAFEKFIAKATELYIKTNVTIPTELLRVRESKNLISAFCMGLIGTTDDESFKPML